MRFTEPLCIPSTPLISLESSLFPRIGMPFQLSVTDHLTKAYSRNQMLNDSLCIREQMLGQYPLIGPDTGKRLFIHPRRKLGVEYDCSHRAQGGK